MRKKTCCVTGHRDLPQKEINYVKAALGREVDRAVADGYTCFMSGFGEGVDQYFAEIVLERQKETPALELIAVIPYRKRLDNLKEKGIRFAHMLKKELREIPVGEIHLPQIARHALQNRRQWL